MILEKNDQLQKIPVIEIYGVKVRKFFNLKKISGIGGTYVFIGMGALAFLSLFPLITDKSNSFNSATSKIILIKTSILY